MHVGDCDRIFIASKFMEDKSKSKDLCRFMFLEGIVRVALKRFMSGNHKECDTPDEAVKKTLETIEANQGPDMWEDWRWKVLYHVDVNDVLHSNIASLRSLFRTYLLPKEKFLKFNDTMSMITNIEGLSAHQI